MAKMRKALWLTALVFAISWAGNGKALGQGKPTGGKAKGGTRARIDMRGFMQKMLDTYVDKQNGGVYSACSEDFSKVVDSRKRAADQFLLARSYTFQHVASGKLEPKEKAIELVSLALKKFEDRKNGGYHALASNDWMPVGKEKDLTLMGEIFDVILHLYERTYDDADLLKGFEILDLMMENGEDKENGGIFDSFAEDWTPTSNLEPGCTGRYHSL